MAGASVIHLEGEEAVFSLYSTKGVLLCFYHMLPTSRDFDSAAVNSRVEPQMKAIGELIEQCGVATGY